MENAGKLENPTVAITIAEVQSKKAPGISTPALPGKETTLFRPSNGSVKTVPGFTKTITRWEFSHGIGPGAAKAGNRTGWADRSDMWLDCLLGFLRRRRRHLGPFNIMAEKRLAMDANELTRGERVTWHHKRAGSFRILKKFGTFLDKVYHQYRTRQKAGFVQMVWIKFDGNDHASKVDPRWLFSDMPKK